MSTGTRMMSIIGIRTDRTILQANRIVIRTNMGRSCIGIRTIPIFITGMATSTLTECLITHLIAGRDATWCPTKISRLSGWYFYA